MPELPEVETTLRGIEPYVVGQRIREVIVRNRNLRWPVPDSIHDLEGQVVRRGSRRGNTFSLALTKARSCCIWACQVACASVRPINLGKSTITSRSRQIRGGKFDCMIHDDSELPCGWRMMLKHIPYWQS